MSIPVFIPASPKDQLKLKYCIRQAARHITDAGDFYVSVPDKTQFKDYVENGHEVKFFEDFELLPALQNIVQRLRFRPNWWAQQFLKMLQPATPGKLYFCLDADCFVCKDMPLTSGGKPKVFCSPNPHDESAFHRWIARISGGELHRWVEGRYDKTTYIADMQMFDREEFCRLVKRYYPAVDDFVMDSVINNYWRQNDVDRAIFPSEYELVGLWYEKMCPGKFERHFIQKRQVDRNQMSQQGSAWTEDEIKAEIDRAEKDGVEILKLQSNSPLHDVGWKVPGAVK